MALADNALRNRRSIKRKIRSGFYLGASATFAGLAVRFFAKSLSWRQTDSSSSILDSDAHEMWIQISMATIAFGLAVLVVTINRWLHSQEN